MGNSALSHIVTFDDFARVSDPGIYRPLPGDWWVGVTDVVESTRAIRSGGYKSVNMAGASAISAAMNALGGRRFPFAFGGDGAQLAVAPADREAVEEALARTVRWVSEELSLDLRAAMIPLSDIRAAGHDVLLANFAPSDAVRYAMFSGGGMEWAEDQLKAGRYAVAPAPPGMRPDLSGLSCRWQPVRARAGVMLSLVVRRATGVADDLFHEAVGQILDLIAREMPGRNPVSDSSLKFGSPLTGFALEARVEGAAGYRRLKLFLWRVMSWAIVRGRLRAGGFNPLHYRDQTVRNSDFRKFHDGLDMTLDCTPGQAETIEALLDSLAGKGVIRFGTHRQQEALMTCIVPSYTADDHLHFIDGAGGGYAEAARRLKAMK